MYAPPDPAFGYPLPQRRTAGVRGKGKSKARSRVSTFRLLDTQWGGEKMKAEVSKRCRLWGSIVVLFALMSGPVLLHAQQYFGTIVGTVSDPSGATIPGATVTVTNTQTGIARQVKTDQAGDYTVGSLVPGTYSVKAEQAGFGATELQQVDLPVARTVTVNVVMKLGPVTQTVEVQAAAPLLDTANSTVGTVVNNKSVVQLPLNRKNYT